MRNVLINKYNLFLSFIVVLLLQHFFAFAKFKTSGKDFIDNKPYLAYNNIKLVNKSLPTNSSVFSSTLFDSLQLEKMGLNREVFNYALKGFNYMSKMGMIKNSSILSIVDFSKPSSEKRLYIIDLQKVQVLYKTYVAHGSKSGKEFANQFSNIIKKSIQ